MIQYSLKLFKFDLYRMPECVLFHFEQGLQSFEDLSFKGHNEHYILTQIIQYKRSPDHFICWTREPKGMEAIAWNCFSKIAWFSNLSDGKSCYPGCKSHFDHWQGFSFSVVNSTKKKSKLPISCMMCWIYYPHFINFKCFFHCCSYRVQLCLMIILFIIVEKINNC